MEFSVGRRKVANIYTGIQFMLFLLTRNCLQALGTKLEGIRRWFGSDYEDSECNGG